MRNALTYGILVLGWLGVTQEVHAQGACGGVYTVQSGDTLTTVSSKLYGSSRHWRKIYYENQDVIGRNPNTIRLGAELSVPCLEEAVPAQTAEATPEPESQSSASPRAAAETPPVVEQPARSVVAPQAPRRERRTPLPAPALQVLTGSDYKPFTDRELPGGGMVTDIMQRAFGSYEPVLEYNLTWINDWSSHFPLLEAKKFDIGFPWLRPDCENPDDLSDSMRARCDYLFSDPVFEMLVMMYRRADSNIDPREPMDFADLTVCRPLGYFTFDFEELGLKPGENLSLVQPQSINECFLLLQAGKVDLVSINEFTGREAIVRLGLEDDVSELSRFATIQGQYAIIHRSHPRATVLMHQLNTALRDMRETGELAQLQADHLERYYASLD